MPTGVYSRPSPEERFWRNVDKNGPVPKCRPELGSCWLWKASCWNNGYGVHSVNRKIISAHRFSLMIAGISIPKTMQSDHLCRVRRCVRPSHLEVVTQRENLLRGESFVAANAKKTHCPRGHPYSGNNLRLYARRNSRFCRTCARLWRELNGKKENQKTTT